MANGSSSSNWLGFSLWPPHCADDVSGQHVHQQQPAAVDSSFYYGVDVGVGGHHGVVTSAGLSSMPLMSDFSIVATDQEHHHGVAVSSSSPKLDDFVGMGGPAAMALSLGNSTVGDGAIMAGCTCDHPHPLTLRTMCSARDSEPYINMAAMDAAGKKRGGRQKQQQHGKSMATFRQTSSQYRGVTRHRWTRRYEAHFWDNSCKKEGQARKGRQGGYDTEEKAARAYDLAILKCWGHTTAATHINFPLEQYHEELELMKNMNKEQYVTHIRRKSTGFSRGASKYRGVTRHHPQGRWQARIGRVEGNKDLYLGTFATQEEAAEAYDVAAIKFRGRNTVTNFDITRYDVDKILADHSSSALLQADRACAAAPQG